MSRFPESSAFRNDDEFSFAHVEQYMHACKVSKIVKPKSKSQMQVPMSAKPQKSPT